MNEPTNEWADGDDFMAEAANLDDVDPTAAQVEAADPIAAQATPNAIQDQAAINAVQDQAALNAVQDQAAANAVQDQAAANAAQDQAAANAVQDQAALNAVQDQAAANAVQDQAAANAVQDQAALNAVQDQAAANAVQVEAAPNAAPMQAAPVVHDLNVLVYGIANAVHALLVQGPHGQIAAVDQVPMEQEQAQPQNEVQDAPNGGQVAAQDQIAHGEDQPAQDPVATGANIHPVGPREFSRHDLLEMYPGMAQSLLSIMEDLREIRANSIDCSRMISKRHLVIQGAIIPPQQPGEDVTHVFLNFIAREVGIWIRPDDLGQVHRRQPNGFIVEFLNRKNGSPFMRLLRVKASFDLQIELRLINEDKKILEIAKEMLHSGLISNFNIDPVSGKVRVTFGRNNRIMSISDVKRIQDLQFELENHRRH
jgi:hypothetical protein